MGFLRDNKSIVFRKSRTIIILTVYFSGSNKKKGKLSQYDIWHQFKQKGMEMVFQLRDIFAVLKQAVRVQLRRLHDYDKN